MDTLVLRFEGPMMSFGGPMVDQHGITLPFPGRSMLVGLLGNALGYEHRDATLLGALQERMRYAVRCDREGFPFVDYHTVDLGQDHLVDTGWTTHGVRQDRAGANSRGTHIRFRHYLADAVLTIAMTLDRADVSPTLTDIEEALVRPARPLFLGRKTCLPSAPIFQARVRGESLAGVLRTFRGAGRSSDSRLVRAYVPPESTGPGFEPMREWRVVDDRDWSNQIHVGERRMIEGRLELEDGRA